MGAMIFTTGGRRAMRWAMGDGLSRRDDDVGDAMERRAVMMCRMASAALRPCR
jgi:hypothetical protein